MISDSFARSLLVIGGICTSMSSVLLAQDYPYALIELPRLNGPGSAAYTLNGSGQISGVSDIANGAWYRAVVWSTAGSPTDLGTLGGDFSEARDINALGNAVGWATFQPGTSWRDHRAFLWRDGQIIDLGTLGGERSEANAVNDQDQVVGFAETPESGGGFVWENGQMTALPTLGRNGGTAHDINNSGDIVGRSWPLEGNERAVLWRDGQIMALPALRSDPSSASAINELGQIVGQSRGLNEMTHAVAWINQQVFDLHDPGVGQESAAFGINEVGQVVGWVGQQPLNAKAFVWDQMNGMRKIDSLLPPRPRRNWTLIMAQGVNNDGQIAAYGHVQGQPLQLVGFLVNPVYPSLELGAPVPGRAPGPNTLTLAGTTPGAQVVFLYSLRSGGQRIPGCDLQQNALQLDNPAIIGTAIADQHGIASITRSVPIIARGQTILFQAVVQNECAISQLVVHQFE